MNADATIKKLQQKYKVNPLGWADVARSLNSVAYNKRRAADCIWCARLTATLPRTPQRVNYIAKQLAGARAHRLAAVEVSAIN